MSRRLAALAAEQKTKEELDLVPAEDDGEDSGQDESFELKDAQEPAKTKKATAAGRRGTGGGGICLSDDEEEEEYRKQNSERVEEEVERASETTKIETDRTLPANEKPSNVEKQENDAEKKRPIEPDPDGGQKKNAFTSMGSILARMNRPKKKQKKGKGGVLDQSIARLLNEDPSKNFDKKAASEAAKAALARVGKMKVMEEVSFAGQTISVARTMERSSKEAQLALETAKKETEMSTLDKIVGELKNPKKSISAVEKSSYDWDKFKEEQGIGDQLEKYAQNGYVEKQAFLQRVDQRTFEVEKAERDRVRAMTAAAAAKAEKK